LFHLVFEFHSGRALGADSEEKHETVSDIDTPVVDSLKALDPRRPIREADIATARAQVRK
jgi:erythromycin esterase-like protein